MRTAEYIQHGVRVLERRIPVPLNPQNPGAEKIEIFAREIVRPGGEQLPHLLFLQGGPGGAGPRPGNFRDGWIGAALENHRVVLMDQRGTGQSTPFTTLNAPSDPEGLASYLQLFLQPQIVEDAESLREALEVDRWVTLGQSYGGFLTLAYLSEHPESIRRAYITGGLPGLVPIDDIYRRTYRQAARQNRVYYDRYAEDENTVRQIAKHLQDVDERLPTGERLTPNRFRTVGMNLGTQTGFDQLHYLLEGPFTNARGTLRLHPAFLNAMGTQLSYGGRPLYAALQEAIYGPTSPGGTRWAAERIAKLTPGFHPEADPADISQPWYLTGEHMLKSLFDEDPALSPLADAVNVLAEKTDWTQIYDQSVLSEGECPVTAAVYYDDMFVPRSLSMETASQIGNVRTLVTSEFQHDGLRSGNIFQRLVELGRD